MVSWLQGRNIMVDGCGGAKLLSLRQPGSRATNATMENWMKNQIQIPVPYFHDQIRHTQTYAPLIPKAEPKTSEVDTVSKPPQWAPYKPKCIPPLTLVVHTLLPVLWSLPLKEITAASKNNSRGEFMVKTKVFLPQVHIIRPLSTDLIVAKQGAFSL